MKSKICGITNLADALIASQEGADFIGLIFAQNSPRKISLEQACKISSGLPHNQKKVGVFLDCEISFIIEVAAKCGLYAVQLHGHEDSAYIESLKEASRTSNIHFEIWKAIHLESDLLSTGVAVDAFVVDSSDGKILGGTGKRSNWIFAKLLARSHRVILAGGMSSEIVADAVREVSPYAIDANSALEISPRKKDENKVRTFLKIIKDIKC